MASGLLRDFRLSVRLAGCRLSHEAGVQYYGDLLQFSAKLQKITQSVGLSFLKRGRIVKRRKHFILGGSWDIEAMNFAEGESCATMTDLFVNCCDFRQTDRYRRFHARLVCGDPVKHRGDYLRTEHGLENYFRRYYEIFEDMKTNGYKSQRELGGNDQEIGVAIGRKGNILHFWTGQHRLAMAKILGLETVPVVVHLVHYRWLLKCVKKYKVIPSRALLNGLKRIAQVHGQ